MALPKTYKAAVLENIGSPLVVKDLELQMPGPGEVLVKILASGVCGSDAILAKQGFANLEKPMPLVPGHELVGDIVAVGEGVTTLSLGDRVGGGWHGGHDGSCRACQRGVFQMCDHEHITGVTRNGGFAEYAIVRADGAVHLPRDCDPIETAPLLCAGVTVFNSLRRQGIPQGGLVAVQGFGALGHLAVQFTQKMGYDVVVISSGESKREYALQLGAIGYINASTEDPAAALKALGGAVAVVCTAPSPATVGRLLYGLQELGTLLVLSLVNGVSMDLTPIILRGLKVAGWPAGHALDSADTVRFAERHGVKTMIERYKFSDFDAAWDRMISGKARFKVVLDMQQ
ncbi:hypothetical protein SBRCBS47491_002246 [Sporothrix bragantina]|uniref:Enoyl reductase (ER) domain-containing protein n=1 Tax=Sporothrix bragantina TaxID=671064 RepID=A0ABP0B578_9PEZI